jgi:uncharacterized protein (DUF488 family)
VHVLVDVRLNAISRKRGFSKKSLAAALEQADIEYLHMPALGNERTNRSGYAELASADASDARGRFMDALSGEAATASLHELAAIARTTNVAVLCFEKDERHCHREQVIERVRALLQPATVGS